MTNVSPVRSHGTVGLDIGLEIVARQSDEIYATAMQLPAGYAPEPRFDAVTPQGAAQEVANMTSAMLASRRPAPADCVRQPKGVTRQRGTVRCPYYLDRGQIDGASGDVSLSS